MIKIKANEYLFDEFKRFGYRIEHLRAIVSNDMEITEEQRDEWILKAESQAAELANLIQTTKRFLYGEVP